MADDAVGFYLNVEKLFGSIAFQRMSFSAKGVYLCMLFQQWREKQRNLPDDPQAVAEMIAVSTEQTAELAACWDVVRRKFVTSRHDAGRIYNVEVENTRRQQRAYYAKRRDDGRKGGLARAYNIKKRKDLILKHPTTTLQHSATTLEANVKGGQAIREEERREDKNREEQKGHAADFRSRRPIFTGQKLTVFEWMLEECMKTLGDFTDAFDLHAWFSELDQRAVRTNLVIPRRDGGEWLLAQLVAEAKRRGLPLVVVAEQSDDESKLAALLKQGPSKR